MKKKKTKQSRLGIFQPRHDNDTLLERELIEILKHDKQQQQGEHYTSSSKYMSKEYKQMLSEEKRIQELQPILMKVLIGIEIAISLAILYVCVKI